MTMQKVEAALEAAAHAMEWAQPHLEADPITEERGINEAHAHALAKVKDALAFVRSDAQGERGGPRRPDSIKRYPLERIEKYEREMFEKHGADWRILIGYDGFSTTISASAADTPSASDWEAGASAAPYLRGRRVTHHKHEVECKKISCTWPGCDCPALPRRP